MRCFCGVPPLSLSHATRRPQVLNQRRPSSFVKFGSFPAEEQTTLGSTADASSLVVAVDMSAYASPTTSFDNDQMVRQQRMHGHTHHKSKTQLRYLRTGSSTAPPPRHLTIHLTTSPPPPAIHRTILSRHFFQLDPTKSWATSAARSDAPADLKAPKGRAKSMFKKKNGLLGMFKKKRSPARCRPG